MKSLEINAFSSLSGSISDISTGFNNALSGNGYINDANRFCDERGEKCEVLI